MPFLDNRSIVGTWKVIVPEGEFLIEFEHGTTSGKRVIWINGNVSLIPLTLQLVYTHCIISLSVTIGILAEGLDVSSSRP